MQSKRWTILPEGDKPTVSKLSQELGISPILAKLLVQRGINTFEEAKAFFRPSLDSLHEPFLMRDMDKAVARLEQALEEGQKILVFGDYDVDGTTAVALMYSFIKEKLNYPNVEFYIPDRYTEGYGISKQGIDYAASNNFSLIIALDCGVKSVELIAYAKSKGVDFIVCDHHLPGDTLPPAVAVLDPKRSDCKYPYKELCGCGVGFKLVQAYCKKNNIPFTELDEYFDLLAVSIAADIVPVTGENRVLVYYGLKRLSENPRKGLKRILELNKINGSVSVTNVVFVIAPRINAAGRMESGRKAVELLIAKSDNEVESIAQDINKNNTDRREADKDITAEALAMIAMDDAFLKRKSTVLFNPSWHKGVIGIVASRLIENHYRPTVMLTESNGKATGSARSIEGFDLYEAIESCADLLTQFGGHKHAAGLTMPVENIEAFKQKFDTIVQGRVTEEMLIPQIPIDAELELKDIDAKFFRVLQQFAPFGPGNMTPVFKINSAADTGYSKLVGEKHLKMELHQPANGSEKFAAIAFGFGAWQEKVSNKTLFDACISIEENVWNGLTTIQLKVRDIKIVES